MSGIQGATSGAGGVDPRRIGDLADAQSDETGSLSDPSLPPVQPDIDSLRTGMAPGQRTGASFKSPVDTTDAGQAATTTGRQSQERPIREELNNLVSSLKDLGFSSDQIDQIVGSRGKTEDTLGIFRRLQQFCNALRIDRHRTDQQVPEQLGLLPAQLVTLVKAGGADALDALTNAYSDQTELPNAGELCGLLQVLGTIFGHSYKQLANISLDNADALSALRDVHEELELLEILGTTDIGHDNSEALQEQRDIEENELGDPRINEMRKRTNKLGALAHRGGVAALRTLTSVALTGPSPSLLHFDDSLVQALRATGLKPREIERL